MPVFYDGEGVYQINKLEYSYTNGYEVNSDVSYKIDCEDKCILIIKEYGKDEKDVIKNKINLIRNDLCSSISDIYIE